MFLDPIAGAFRAQAELVGLCDPSETRRLYHQRRLDETYKVGRVPTYGDFAQMLKEQHPETIIVCTPDYLHDEYIVRSLEAGCDVITEKPLTTDEVKCRRILDAVARTGRSVRVTFNLRWMPSATRVKELITEGTIGSVQSVMLEYMIGIKHGSEYFRRWHSEKSKSGGLLVHKSTHHFDLVNWLIDAIPESVVAFGGLSFYGRENAVARGEGKWTSYARYIGAPDSDPFKLDLAADPTMKALYLDAEKDSGYIRDRNVFRDGIDIEDSIGVLVRYRDGTTLTYSLTAFCPREGFRLILNGDRGRIEYTTDFQSELIGGKKDQADESKNEGSLENIRVMPLFGESYEVPVPESKGSHGGGDILLQERLFSGAKADNSLGHDAGPEQGAASALIGFAANLSLKTGQVVQVSNLLPLKPKAVRLSELT